MQILDCLSELTQSMVVNHLGLVLDCPQASGDLSYTIVGTGFGLLSKDTSGFVGDQLPALTLNLTGMISINDQHGEGSEPPQEASSLRCCAASSQIPSAAAAAITSCISSVWQSYLKRMRRLGTFVLWMSLPSGPGFP